MKLVVAPLSIKAERVYWSWQPVGHTSTSILSLFVGLTVCKKNLVGMVRMGALLRCCRGKGGWILIVQVHCGVTTTG